jgi:sugar lactone lactonase YvrE
MNLCFGPDGSLYTSESGLGRVKRHTPDGKLIELVGYSDVTRFTRAGRLAASCSNIAIGLSPDGKRIYVQDLKENTIHILERKGS